MTFTVEQLSGSVSAGDTRKTTRDDPLDKPVGRTVRFILVQYVAIGRVSLALENFVLFLVVITLTQLKVPS